MPMQKLILESILIKTYTKGITMLIKVFRVKSDNFEGLITPRAYRLWLVPSMSTGDWHTHTKSIVEVESNAPDVRTCNDFEDEHYECLTNNCPTCGRSL